MGGVWRDLWSQRHRGRLPGHRWGHRDHDLHQERSDSGIKSIYLCVKIPDHKCKIKTPNCLLEYLLVSCFMEVRSGSKLDPFRIQQLCGSGSTQLKWRKARQTDKNSPSLFRLFFERYGMPLKPKKLQEYNYIFLLQIDNASVWNVTEKAWIHIQIGANFRIRIQSNVFGFTITTLLLRQLSFDGWPDDLLDFAACLVEGVIYCAVCQITVLARIERDSLTRYSVAVDDTSG